MTKKEYILELLSALKDDFPIARALYDIVKVEDISDDLLDNIFETFKLSVKEINDEWKKEKIRNAMNTFKKRMEGEKKEQDEDNIELLDLEKQLDDLF